jgi:hypothetical protein
MQQVYHEHIVRVVAGLLVDDKMLRKIDAYEYLLFGTNVGDPLAMAVAQCDSCHAWYRPYEGAPEKYVCSPCFQGKVAP